MSALSPAKTPGNRLSRSRIWKDKLASITITAGGLAVLGAILLIFFYLLYEIMALFKAATIKEEASYTVPAVGDSPLLYLAMEEQAEIAFAIDASGEGLFFQSTSGDLIKKQALMPAGPSSFALNSDQSPLFALASHDGEVLLAAHEYRISYPDDRRLITPVFEFPYGAEPFKLSNKAISKLAVRDSEESLVIVALTEDGLLARRWSKEEDFLSEAITLEEQVLSLPPIDIPVEHILIGPDQRWLYLISELGEFRIIDIKKQSVVSSGSLLSSGLVPEVKFLLGGISLLVASDEGSISQWFMVQLEGERPRLQQIRQFKNGDKAIRAMAVEHRRKGFIAIDTTNELDVYYTTSHRRLLSEKISDFTIENLALAPRANAFLTMDSKGRFNFWRLHNEHPEISWSALWSKVWYESYPEPDYIWQSSASGNDFEPKYSFSPLAFGTLKVRILLLNLSFL